MTYIELIVVLSIFAVMSSIGLLNYKAFQAKVDIKNLANEIALKFVQAQKEATSGKLPVFSYPAVDPWKPSYGLYFDPTDTDTSFIYFVDLDNGGDFDAPFNICPNINASIDCIEIITITKGNRIDKIEAFTASGAV